MKQLSESEVEVIEEWGKIGQRVYHAIFIWKKDKRYKLGKRRQYLKAEWEDEKP